MSAEITTLTDLPKEIVAEVKEQAKPATKQGIVNQVVGFGIGVPLAILYDKLYNLVAAKAITNEIARDIIKVALPLGIGLGVHVSKIPFGNIIAGTGYCVALISAGKILYTRIKGLLGKTVKTDVNIEVDDLEGVKLWGVQ